MARANNTFYKGLNSDLSPVSPQKDTYLDAHDITIITDTGRSTYALSNVKGHSYSFSFGMTSSVNSISFTGTIGDVSPVTISIDGLVDIFTPSSWTNLGDLYIQLADFINASLIFQGAGVTYNAYSQPTQVILYSPDNIAALGIVLINPDYTTSEILPTIDDFFLIGYTVIRDKIILITTSSQDPNPNGIDPDLPADPQSSGQIWQLTFNSNNVPTLELKYNNIINLTAAHPIPSPGAIVGRYETANIQSVYFTDNFNRPRRLNIADPGAFGLTVQELYLQSNINSSVPILQRIEQAGAIKTGMHQFAFRLKSNSGSQTVFSMPSNLISATSSNEDNAPFHQYVGSDSELDSGKSFTLFIPEIENKYDRIEVVDIYFRDSVDPVPEINIFLDEPIGTNTSFTFTFTGSETFIPITVDEYLTFQTEVSRVKTLVSKNNRLIQGNIVEKRLDFAYDSRAYRYDYNGDTYVTPAEIADLTSDAINTNQSPIPHEQGYIFQDPAINSGNLIYGGSGVNIKYEFVPDNTSITNQDTDALTAKLFIDNKSSWNGVPYRDILRTTVDHNLNGEYRPVVNSLDNFTTGYVSSVIRGYTRDEVYRYAIVFYDLLGNPGFANWIADIRMPHPYMPDPTSPITDVDRVLAFPQGDINGSRTDAYSLGIKFTINVPDIIKSQVSGYSIVRAERKEEDRSILGQGILEPSWQLASIDKVYLADEGFDPEGLIGGISDDAQYNGSTQLTEMNGDFASFISPEQQFNTVDFNYKNGDAIDVVGVLGLSFSGYAYKSHGVPVNAGPSAISIPDTQPRGWVSKHYTYTSGLPTWFYDGGTDYLGLMPLRLNFSMEWNSSYITQVANDLVTNKDIYNCSPPRAMASSTDKAYAGSCNKLVLGSGDYLFGGNSFGDFPALFNNNGITTTWNGSSYTKQDRVLLVNYKREVLKQYGGNTYNQRSNTKYIPTGHYVRLDGTSTNINTSVVYGGDTFITAYEAVTRHKSYLENLGIENAIPFTDNGQYCTFKGRIFLVETTVNTELRRSSNSLIAGAVLNKHFVPDLDTVGTSQQPSYLDIYEEYILNSTYSRESNVYNYIPKPDPFNEVSEFDTRIRASEEKLNGELIDSWGVYKVGTHIDVDGIYGPINGMVVNKERLLYFQDRAFGTVDVNARSLVQDQTGSSIQIGSSGLLSRYDYISTEIGSKHQWSILQGNSKIYFLDAFKRKLYAYSEQGIESLSELHGLSGYFNEHIDGTILTNDNPILGRGVVFTFDYKFSRAFFTFRGSRRINNQSVLDRWTLAYDENINTFSSFYAFTPPIYINSIDRIFSSQNEDDYYQHNVGPYNVYYNNAPVDSTIKFVVNDSPEDTKKFDYLTWVTEVYDTAAYQNLRSADTWSTIRVYNDHQNSGYIDLIPKPTAGYNVARNRNREWTMHVPRNSVLTGSQNIDILDPANLDITQTFKPRMSDSYMVVDLKYDNANNYKFVCPFVITDYRSVY